MNMSRTQRGVEISTRSQTDLDDPPPSKRPAGWVNLRHICQKRLPKVREPRIRKRVKHVWTLWNAVSKQLRPALAAQHRLAKQRCRPNPARAAPRGGPALDPFGVPG